MLQMEVGTGEETRGVMGEGERRTPVPGPSRVLSLHRHFPEVWRMLRVHIGRASDPRF